MTTEALRHRERKRPRRKEERKKERKKETNEGRRIGSEAMGQQLVRFTLPQTLGLSG
jgi:hypothetical protein